MTDIILPEKIYFIVHNVGLYTVKLYNGLYLSITKKLSIAGLKSPNHIVPVSILTSP